MLIPVAAACFVVGALVGWVLRSGREGFQVVHEDRISQEALAEILLREGKNGA